VGAGRLIGGAGVRTALPGAPLGQGDILETDTAAVALRSPDGTRLVVGPHTDLALARDGGVRWFRLARGQLDLEVAKLSQGERFVVETPDREVEVKGTRFKIQLVSRDTCGAGTITRVNVEKGVVTVREKDGAEDAVRAGGSWPTACADGHAAVVQARRETSGARAAETLPRTAATSLREKAKPSPAVGRASSTLAIENDLFTSAVRAERLGDKVGALNVLDRLINSYPGSPLREAATSERLKVAGASPAGLPVAPPTRGL
jgi:ferric-dicitrate binding protein FerR (iron transport regulator)